MKKRKQDAMDNVEFVDSEIKDLQETPDDPNPCGHCECEGDQCLPCAAALVE